MRGVRTSVFYDDCFAGRGRCLGRRPCLEPGDQMLSCRATALGCATAPWRETLSRAKAWVPAGHAAASLLYLFDGASHDAFDETFRAWSPRSVGYGASPIVFGPQFASARAREVNASLELVAAAVRRADACAARPNASAAGGPPPPRRPTALIFRSPAFNIDPVNSFKQQAGFARKHRPAVEAAGATFLDTYAATRHAALQPTAHAIRFDHNSAFHFFDSGRYLQAQLLLHVLRLLEW